MLGVHSRLFPPSQEVCPSVSIKSNQSNPSCASPSCAPISMSEPTSLQQGKLSCPWADGPFYLRNHFVSLWQPPIPPLLSPVPSPGCQEIAALRAPPFGGQRSFANLACAHALSPGPHEMTSMLCHVAGRLSCFMSALVRVRLNRAFNWLILCLFVLPQAVNPLLVFRSTCHPIILFAIAQPRPSA